MAAGWFEAADLLDPDGPLVEVLGEDRSGRGARDRRVAASSFFQGHAVHVLGRATRHWLRGDGLPDVAAGNLRVQLVHDLPMQARLHEERLHAGPPGELLQWFCRRAFVEHLDPLASTITRLVPGVGDEVLWAGAAASVAAVGAEDGRPSVRSFTSFFDRLPHHLVARGRFESTDGGPTSWIRGTCCLWHLEDADGARCRSCDRSTAVGA
jgi:hypothetical protein